MKKLIAATFAMAIAGAGVAPAHAATLIYSQSFEVANGAIDTTTIGNYVYSANGVPGNGINNTPSGGINFQGVTFGGSSGIQSNGSAWGFQTAPDGTQTAFLQSNGGPGGTISVALPDLVAGQLYSVAFDLAKRPNYNLNTLTVAIDGVTKTYPTPTDNWGTFSFSFTANGSDSPLLFTAATTNGADTSVGLDNIAVAAIPEPTTWAMLLLGFGMIGFAMRKRSNVRTSVSYA